jgi:hypothetical protein
MYPGFGEPSAMILNNEKTMIRINFDPPHFTRWRAGTRERLENKDTRQKQGADPRRHDHGPGHEVDEQEDFPE